MNRDALIHGVILEGGEAANVIPDRTRCRFYIRSIKEELIDEVYDRFAKMVEGAALMTGCTSEINQYSIPYKGRKPNSFLNELFIAGAKELDMNVTDELPHGRGSSDFGDFSHAAPGAHPYFSICEPGLPAAPGHSELMKKYANSDYGYNAMLNAGAVLAMCALRILEDPEFRAAVRAEFEKK